MNSSTPPKTEPIALATVRRDRIGQYLELTTPCCQRRVIHAPPFAADMGSYSRRTCDNCGAGYWIHVSANHKTTMKPYSPIKRRCLPRPQVTRRQLHALVGRAICDQLLHEPQATHFDEATAEAIVTELIQLLQEQPYY
jgi:hypothetical protein